MKIKFLFLRKFGAVLMTFVFVSNLCSPLLVQGLRPDFLNSNSSENFWESDSATVDNEEAGIEPSEELDEAEREQELLKNLNKIDVSFIQNKGQVKNDSVEFFANIFTGHIYVQNDGLTYNIIEKEERGEKIENEEDQLFREKPSSRRQKGYVFNEKFVTTNDLTIKGEDRSNAKMSFFGKDKENNGDVPSYNKLSYDDVWSNIDVELAATGGNVEKIFYVNPNGNSKDIKMQIEGADDLYVSEDGRLILETVSGEIAMTAPIAFQNDKDGKKQKVQVSYEILGDGKYGFNVGEYDEERTLIIDPLLAGTAFGSGDYMEVNAITTDVSGNIYAVGYAYFPWFPTTVGAYDTDFTDWSGYISKFNSDMTSLLASTFLGDTSEIFDIYIDESNGNVVVTGVDYDGNHPTTAGAYDTTIDLDNNGFISILDSSLSSLLYSTFIGGTSHEYVHSVEKDSSGNIFVTGTTYSANFPSTAGAYQITHGGGTRDAFVSKFNSDLSSLLASTFLGGASSDQAYSLAFDSSDDVFIVGVGPSFPTTAGAYSTTICASGDTYVAKFSNDLSTLTAATYICGSGDEDPYEILIDASENVVIGGSTSSSGTDYPTTTGAYDETHNGNYDFYISILDNTLSSLVASTFLGGPETEWYAMGHDVYHNMAIDSAGNIFFSGISCFNYPTTTGAFRETTLSEEVGHYAWCSFEPVVSKLSADLSQLEASTFFGGTEYAQGAALAVDASDNIILGGTAYDAEYYYYYDEDIYYFPVSPDAYSDNFYSEYSGYLTKLDNNLSAQVLDHFTIRTDDALATEGFDGGSFPPTNFTTGGDASWEQYYSVPDSMSYIDTAIMDPKDEYSPSPSTVFTDSLTGYVFYIDSTGQSLAYSKTTDGGSSWSAVVVIDTVIAGWTNVAVWYDQWTPGDTTGTLIHIAAVQDSSDDVHYTYLDAADDSLRGSLTVALAGSTFTEASNGPPSITKSAENNLFISCNFTNYTGSAGGAVAKSEDAGASWTPYDTGWSTVAIDQVQLLPLLTDNDIIAIRADTTNDEMDYQIYDEVADAWAGSWTSIATMTEDTVYDQWFGASLRKSTGDIYLSFANFTANVSNDIEFWSFDDDAGPRIWTKQTNLFDDNSTVMMPAPVVDDSNGDIYIAYLRGNLVYNTTYSGMNVYFKRSTDGGSTWEAESSRLNYTAGDTRALRTNLLADHRPFVVWGLYYNDLLGETMTATTQRAAAKSGNISSGESTYLQTSYNFTEEGKIAFRWNADISYGNYLIFCIDNNANCNFNTADYAAYEGTEYEVILNVDAGTHDFRWEYIKSTDTGRYGDEAWVDDIRFISASDQKTISSGDTATVKIKMYDDNGAIWGGYYGDKVVTFSGASSSGGNDPTCVDKDGVAVPFGTPTTLRFIKGIATCAMTLYAAETVSIDVTNGTVDSSADASYDIDVTVTGGAPSTLSPTNSIISTPSTTATVGTGIDITLTSYDTDGNPYTTGGETVVISVSGSNTATPAVTDVGDGTYTASYTPTNSGADTVTATIGGVAVGSDSDGTSDGTYNITINAALANVPINLAGLAGVDSINLSWDSNSNPAGTEYYAENVTQSTNSGWITQLTWDSTGLSCGNSYQFRTKARNSDSVETAFSNSLTMSTSGCPGGGFPSDFIQPPEPPEKTPDNPEGEFKVEIDQGEETTDKRKVKLDFTVGSDTVKMALSNRSDFHLSGIEEFTPSKEWDICGNEETCEAGDKTVYAKFYNQYGQATEAVSDTIRFGTAQITVTIDGGKEKTKYREVSLDITGGNEEEDTMMVSDSPDFCGVPIEPYKDQSEFDLCKNDKKCEAGKKNVYVKVFNKWGISMGLASSDIYYEGDTSGFQLLINQGSNQTKKAAVQLDLKVDSNTDSIEISNEPNFIDSQKISPVSPIDWNLCPEHSVCASGNKIVYTKNYNKDGELIGNSSKSIYFENTEDGIEIVIEKGSKNVKTRKVKLSLVTIPRVSKVKLSDSLDFCEAEEVSIDPDDIETEVDWDLCGTDTDCESGEKEVYGEFYDENNEIIGEAADDIYYDDPTDDFGVIINDDETETKNKQVKLKVTFREETDSIVISDPFNMTDPITIIPATDIVDSIEWDLCKGEDTCPPGKKEVLVKFHNQKGETIGEASDDIYYDDPTDDFGVIINDGETETKNKQVKLKVIFREETDSIIVSDSFSMTEPTTITATDIVDNIEWDLCKGEDTCPPGKKEVFVKFHDKEGVPIGEAADDIYYDDPTDDFGVIINDDETETKNKQVKLKVTFREETDSIVISDPFNMTDPITIIPATDIVDSIEWDLCKGEDTCPPGKKEVLVKFHNQKGETIGEASDDIYYDDPTDDFGVIINDGETETKNKQVKLKVIFREETDSIIVSDSFSMTEPTTITATDIVDNIEWDLCKGEDTCPPGKKEVFVKFHDKEGVPIGEAADDIYYDSPPDDNGSSVPFQTPPPFQGDWNLIPPAPINDIVFVLVSDEAIKEIKELAEVFPKVKEKLKEVEVEIEEIDELKVNDFKKLKEEKITLPNITEVVDLDSEENIPAIPFEELSKEGKEKMPKDIIFAKAGGGKIDMDIDIKIDPNKNLIKEIAFTSGAKIGFYVKPKDKVKTIKGKKTFKPKTKDEEPEVPEDPETPEDPTDPEVLEDPTDPETPEDPTDPETPEDPTDPETPTDPEYPEVGDSDDDEEELSEVDYSDDDDDGIYTGEIEIPSEEGDLEIITVIDYQDDNIEDKEISITIISNPEGYVYEKQDNEEVPIPDVEVLIYQLDQETNQYELFPATEYEQENPQTTDIAGQYSFIIPKGTYYLEAQAQEYLAYQSEPFNAKEGANINGTIELKKSGTEVGTGKAIGVTFFWLIILLLLLLVLYIIKKLFSRDKDENEDDNRSIV